MSTPPQPDFSKPTFDGIPIPALVHRFLMGDSLAKLCIDYHLSTYGIQVILRYALDVYVTKFGIEVIQQAEGK